MIEIIFIKGVFENVNFSDKFYFCIIVNFKMYFFILCSKILYFNYGF